MPFIARCLKTIKRSNRHANLGNPGIAQLVEQRTENLGTVSFSGMLPRALARFHLQIKRLNYSGRFANDQQ